MPSRSNRRIKSWSPRISVAVASGRGFRRSPSQQRQKIAESFRHNAFFAVGNHAGGAVALAQPRFVRAKDQRHVSEYRQAGTQRLVEQNLLWAYWKYDRRRG